MRKNLYIIALLAISMIFPTNAQVTGLSDVRLYIDQGHSGRENMGQHGYSEAENVLRVGLALEWFLLEYTDMQPQNIMLARRNDNVSVGLATRTDQANAFNAHFFYSIHSDAGGPTANSTLFLYGGRRLAAHQTPIEKLPEGGRAFGEYLKHDLTSVLRVNRGGTFSPVNMFTRDGIVGNFADLAFYLGTGANQAPPTRLIPWLHVLRESRMAAHLSEAGFHTNSEQNMQKMNEEWKRLEAYAAFQSLVRFLTEAFGTDGAQEPPQIGIATGFIFDPEVDRPINAATITLTENRGGTDYVRTYTTDCFDSLFNRFYSVTRDRELLRNGFYWVEGFTPGATLAAKIEAEGFETVNTTVTIPATIGARTLDGLGVLDVPMLNLMPSVVTNVRLRRDVSDNVIQRHPIEIAFSRRMVRESVEQAFSISPAANVTLSWINDFTLRVDISELDFETDYTITINGAVARNTVTNDLLDGTGDGTPGGNYVFTFRTSDLDVDPPVVVSFDPQGSQEESARPIVRIEFDELVNEATTFGKISVTDEFGNTIEGVQSYYATQVHFKSVLHFIFEEDLEPETAYVVTLTAGVEDLHGNAMEDDFVFTFTARPREVTVVAVINDFESYPSNGWWQPHQTGQTIAINTVTSIGSTSTQVRPRVDTQASARLNYQFLESADPTVSNNGVRWHSPNNTPLFPSADTHIQFYMFGDGSGSPVFMLLQDATGGLQGYGHDANWVGWRQITVDILNDEYSAQMGTASGEISPTTTAMRGRGFWFRPMPTEERTREISSMYFSRLRAVQLGEFIGTRDSHAVTFSVVGGNGDITAADVTSTGAVVRMINSGDQVFEKRNVTFTAVPSAGFQVKEWTVNGTVVADETGTTLTIENLTANATVTVEFEQSVGFDNIFGSNVSIFPNPFTNVLHITGAENSVLQVTNVLGAVVHTQRIAGANESIYLGELSAGVYFFRLERDGQTKTVTVVKR